MAAPIFRFIWPRSDPKMSPSVQRSPMAGCLYFSRRRTMKRCIRRRSQRASPKAGAGKCLDNFDIAPSVTVVIEDELELAYNQLKPSLALYIGGMGAKGKNFYYDLACRFGFAEAADTDSRPVSTASQRRSDDGCARCPGGRSPPWLARRPASATAWNSGATARSQP